MINFDVPKEYVVNFIKNNKQMIEDNFEVFSDFVDESSLSVDDAMFIHFELEKSGIEALSELFEKKYLSVNEPEV